MVRVKANKVGDIRRFQLADDATFVQLGEQLRAAYKTNNFDIKYKDDEDDLVTVTCDAELAEAMTTARDGGLLRIHLIPLDNGAFSLHQLPSMPQMPQIVQVAPTVPPMMGHPTPPPPPPIGHPPPPPPYRPLAMGGVPNPYAPMTAPLGPPSEGAGAPGPSTGAHPAAGSQPSSRAAPTASAGPSRIDGRSGGASGEESRRGAAPGSEMTPEQMMEALVGIFSNMATLANAFGGMSCSSMGGYGRGRGRFGGRGRGRGWACGRGRGRGRAGHEAFNERARSRAQAPPQAQAEENDEWLQFDINESDFASFVSGFDPSVLGGPLGNISETTAAALRALMTSLMNSPGVAAIMGAVPAAIPVVRNFLADMQGNATLTEERIQALRTALVTALTAALGADNARLVGDFARLAAGDEAVVQLLRNIVGLGASFNGSSADAMRDAGANTPSG